MDDCLFCRIVAGAIPAERIYEDEHCIAFRDIQPQAPVHVLVVPRIHVASLMDLPPELGGPMMGAIQAIARLEGLESPGFRVVTNIGKEGGQSVAHLHWHILGGRAMRWPPG